VSSLWCGFTHSLLECHSNTLFCLKVSPISESATGEQRFVHDLSILVLEMYQQLLAVVHGKVARLLRTLVFVPLAV